MSNISGASTRKKVNPVYFRNGMLETNINARIRSLWEGHDVVVLTAFSLRKKGKGKEELCTSHVHFLCMLNFV
jgi:hypothetical protein